MEGMKDSENEAAPAKSQERRRSRKKEKKALKKRSKAAKGASEQGEEKGTTGTSSGRGKQSALNLFNNPEAKGRGLAAGNLGRKEQLAEPQTTSRGECSGQETPDSS
jgi:hypothetical protein